MKLVTLALLAAGILAAQTPSSSSQVMATLTWGAVSVAGVASLVRLRLRTDRPFQITSLDLIVLFMALVVPSLPGMLNLPHGVALSILKLVVLFYAVEVLASRVEARAVWMRLAVACALAGLAVRSILPF